MTDFTRSQLRLYFICGSQSPHKDTLTMIEEALSSGVTMFQLREKGEGALSGDALKDFAEQVRILTRKYNVPLIINDNIRLAETIDADGIHLGQDDAGPKELPSFFNDKIIGLSVGDEEELNNSNLADVDYIGTGPVFPTSSKGDAGDAISPRGLNLMRRLTGDLPMVAIGGITHDNYHECLDSGADGIAVISAISHAGDIKSAVNNFL